MKRYGLYIVFVIATLLSVTSCTDHDFFTSEDEMVTLSYTIGLAEDVRSRAIGDGSKVDVLYVGIYEGNEEVQRLETVVGNGKANIEINLLQGHTYDLVFWAQYSQTEVYDITDLKKVTIDYPEQMSVQDVANMDAFSLVKKGVTVSQKGEEGGKLTLTRPFALLNIAATGDYDKVQKTELTVTYSDEEPMTITFTGSEEEEEQSYLASAFLKPGWVNAGVRMWGENDEEIENFEFTLELKANYRYNLIDEVVVEEELPCWDGIIPSESTLTQDEQNRYIIDEEADLAWLSVNASSLDGNAGFLVTKETLDMNSLAISSIQLPAGSTFDGNGKTIKNYANSLFGDATNVTVKNLTLDNVTATSDSHVGVLVNTLTGSGTFTNVSISNSSATTENGAAGGMIGYITNKDDETLQVTISACTATDNEVNGSETSGIYVGRFRGYDHSETLTFSSNNNTSSATTTTGKPSYYVSDNAAAWLRENDYSKYSGFLGDEEFYRGTVNYGDVRFVAKWDGTTTIEPIYEDGNTKKVAQIWSAFDLAYLQEKTLTTLRFKSDVDMAGVCADCKDGKGNSTIANDYLSTCDECKAFKPITAINNLYGENHTLHNLFVQGVHEADWTYNDGMGFIRHTNSGTFENFTFDGTVIKCIDDVDFRNDDQKGGNGYAGTLTSRVAGKMTIKNVHAKNGHVMGISKFGGLIGYVPAGIDAEECSVDNYVVENHKINVVNHYEENVEKKVSLSFLGSMTIYASCKEDFYTEGEAGGFIGFISSSATIKDCHVTNTTMKCYGQDNKTTWIYGGLSKDYQSKVMEFEIAGRHVNTFIGDIRTTTTSTTITIDNCSADSSNEYAENYDMDITKEGKGELVGCCYFVGKTVKISSKEMHVGDYQGTVKIDGESMPFVGG